MGLATTCTHCGSTKSPLWRRGIHSEILCNACGLYWKHHGTYRPLSLRMAADKKDYPRSKSPISPLPLKRDSNLRRLKSALAATSLNTESIGIRKKIAPLRSKSSAGKIALPTTYFLPTASGRLRGEPIFAPELPPSTGTINIQLVPAEIKSLSTLDGPLELNESASILSTTNGLPLVKYIMYRGHLLFVGDHVAVRGDDSQIYYAVVHDFWMVPTGQKYVKLQWLLPKRCYAVQIDGPKERLDPSYFTLGPMHTKMEQIESIVDVFFSPQRLQRPLDGPTPVDVPINRSSSLRGSASPPLSTNDVFCDTFALSDGVSTPSSATEKDMSRPYSDSEIEVRRSLLKDHTAITPLEKRHVNIAGAGNILDDVEIAHLLCSMN